MKYFLHDTNSFDDEKITELFTNFGYEGLGLFYTLLEKIAKQEKPVKTQVLKTQLKVGKRLEKCWNFMEEIGIISSKNGDTFNEKLLNYSEMYQIKKEKTRKKVSEWREKQANTESVTCYVPVSNPPKVKVYKVKESKEEEEARKLEIENLKNKKETEFKNCVFEFAKKYPAEMLFIFCDYWTEMNRSKTKMRFELEKTFEISKRLATWASRDKEFNKTKNSVFDKYLKPNGK